MREQYACTCVVLVPHAWVDYEMMGPLAKTHRGLHHVFSRGARHTDLTAVYPLFVVVLHLIIVVMHLFVVWVVLRVTSLFFCLFLQLFCISLWSLLWSFLAVRF